LPIDSILRKSSLFGLEIMDLFFRLLFVFIF
jgi:hypothetical protein